MAELPRSLQTTKEEYLIQFREDVVANSQGRLFDFSVSSVLSIIAEAQSSSLAAFIQAQLDVFPYLSANIVESMGFRRSSGTRAVCTVRFQLANIFDKDYVILKGTRFQVGNTLFETQTDLTITANLDTSNPTNYKYCRVDARALSVGASGNYPAQRATIVQFYPQLDSIWLDEPSAGGRNEETPEQFFDRVSLTIAKFLENQFSLVQASEFELAVQGILGAGSVAVAIPDISDDGERVEVASMNVFAINSDGSALNSAQIRNLSANISNRAPLVQGRLYFNNLTLRKVNITISITIASADNSTTLSANINTQIRSVFSVANTANLKSLELYEAIYHVRNLGGLTPVIRWGYENDILEARDLPLPKIAPITERTAPIQINQVTIVIEPSGLTQVFNS